MTRDNAQRGVLIRCHMIVMERQEWPRKRREQYRATPWKVSDEVNSSMHIWYIHILYVTLARTKFSHGHLIKTLHYTILMRVHFILIFTSTNEEWSPHIIFITTYWQHLYKLHSFCWGLFILKAYSYLRSYYRCNNISIYCHIVIH